jgi:hypothetical protein
MAWQLPPKSSGLSLVDDCRAQTMKTTAEYDLPYLIGRREHLPKDFSVDADFGQLISALFLPSRRHPKLKGLTYSARILLLFPSMVVVVRHPATKIRPLILRLEEIVAVELRHVFPEPLITIRTARAAEEWAYRMQAEGIVRDFLSQLRRFLLREELTRHCLGRNVFGEPLDHKFGCGESDNLERDEPLLARFFSAASTAVRKRWFFRTKVPIAGEYLALATRRILWLSDGIDGVYQPKGMMSSYAALHHIGEIRFSRPDNACEIQVEFCANVRWRVPIQPDFYDEAESFTKQAQRVLQRHGARKMA